MLRSLFLLIAINSSFTVAGQKNLVVNQVYPGNTSYSGYSKFIKNESELPLNIRRNIRLYLDSISRTYSSNISFYEGQIIDLDSFFKSKQLIWPGKWVFPRYDILYLFKDNDIGVLKYYLHIRLDQYGQFLSCNWPKKNSLNNLNLIDINRIKSFAMSEALQRNWCLTNPRIDLEYNPDLDRLCWKFLFTGGKDCTSDSIDVELIPWDELRIVKEYMME